MNNFWKSFFCVIACVFLCVASFFTGYFYRDTVIYNEQQSLSAVSPADAVSTQYSYDGANIYLPVAVLNSSNVVSSNVFSVSVKNFRFRFNYSIDLHSPTFLFYFYVLGFGTYSVDTLTYDSWTNIIYLSNDSTPEKFIAFGYYVDSGFNGNVSSFRIYTGTAFYGDTNFLETNIEYYDLNGKKFRIAFCHDFSSDVGYLDTRTYYLSNNFTDNELYNQGYTTGYSAGEIAGSSSGYRQGYDVGYDDGYDFGYDNGVVSSNDYSFFTLMSSVVEAPVTVFMSLLNFNIMGFNLLDLVVGLLTLGIVCVIVKLCLGGK